MVSSSVRKVIEKKTPEETKLRKAYLVLPAIILCAIIFEKAT